MLSTTIILFLTIIVSIPVSAEDIEETVKYKAPTMDQTVDYIAGIMLDFGDFDSGECLLTTRKVKTISCLPTTYPSRNSIPAQSI